MRHNITRFIISLLLITIFITVSSGSMYTSQSSAQSASKPLALQTEAVAKNTSGTYSKLSLTFIGDLLMHSPQRKSGYNAATNSYNFDYFFKDVKKYFKNKDFVFGTLETPVDKLASDRAYTGYPCFRNPSEYLAAINNSGINVLATANNHTFDQYTSGILATMKWLNYYKIPATGTFRTAKEREQNPVLFLNKNNIKLAFTSYTQISNIKVPASSEYMLNLINLDKIKKDISFAKSKKADVIIIWLHFGTEYQRQPTPYQKNIVQKIAELGADVIIGSHPHVLEPMNVLEVGKRKVFVAYSLGNFISNQYWRYSTDGLILNMDIEKKNGKINFLRNITYIPTAVIREYSGPVKLTDKVIKSMQDHDILTYDSRIKRSDVKYRVVAVEEALENYKTKVDKKLTANDVIRLKTTLSDTMSILGKSQYFKPMTR